MSQEKSNVVQLRNDRPAVRVVPGILLNDDTEYVADWAFVAELQTTYPDLDVLVFLQRMRVWTLSITPFLTKRSANSPKRPERRNIKRFINNWLSKNSKHGFHEKGGNYATHKRTVEEIFQNVRKSEFDSGDLF